MYNTLKKIFFLFIPASLLKSVSPMVRGFLRLWYAGNKHFCPVEKKSYRSFIANKHVDHIELLSPGSGILPRQRLLWLVLEKFTQMQSTLKVLHFSPNAFFRSKIKERTQWQYECSDFETSDCNHRFDITAIKCASNSFDLIICYHVLEHIPNDAEAFKELYRIVKPGGICLLQTPFTDGETLEDPSINSPELRLKHYNQEDHVRIYGFHDFVRRTKAAGFDTEILNCQVSFSASEIARMGLNANERIVLARKTI